MHITCQELHLRETRLREELQSQEAEISRLREELSKCQGLLQEGATPKKQVKLISLITDIAQHTVKGFITFHHNHVINLNQPGSFGHRGSDIWVQPPPPRCRGSTPPPPDVGIQPTSHPHTDVAPLLSPLKAFRSAVISPS